MAIVFLAFLFCQSMIYLIRIKQFNTLVLIAFPIVVTSYKRNLNLSTTFELYWASG